MDCSIETHMVIDSLVAKVHHLIPIFNKTGREGRKAAVFINNIDYMQLKYHYAPLL
jgi:hypothetical protein